MSTPEPPPSKPRSRLGVREGLALALALTVYLALAVHGARQSAGTFDEPAHVSAAWTHLALHDYRLSPDHPPLAKTLAAVPLLFLDVRMDTTDATWRSHRIWGFGRRFLYRWNDADRLLFWSRVPMAVLGAGLILAVFLWTRARFGRAAAALTLPLCVFSPDLLAHGQILTTDLGAAATIFLAVVALDALLRRATPLRMALCGLAVGAALGCKFSALGLVPIFAVLVVVEWLGPGPLRVAFGKERQVEARGKRALWLVGLLLGVAVVAFVGIWACYGFQGSFSADPAISSTFRWDALESEQPMVHQAITTARDHGLLPEPFLFGLVRFLKHSESRRAFLLGKLSDTGFVLYFPVSLLVKTPLPLLLLLVLALVGLLRPGPHRHALRFVWLPVVVYFSLAVGKGMNIGHRHLLPLYPFLFVAAAAAGARLFAWRRPLGRLALGVLCTWYVFGTLRVHPHELSYFNETVGGPANGWRVLVDSNLDWGQDINRLAPWMRAHGIARYKLSYFGTAPPSYYGVDAEMLPSYTIPYTTHFTRQVSPGDVLAVSATNLQGIYLEPQDQRLMARLRQETPIGRVAYSILIYRASFVWPPPHDPNPSSAGGFGIVSQEAE
jgi:hypothetical protein